MHKNPNRGMSNSLKCIFATLVLVVCIASCAKRGTPTGGDKDELPPKFVKSTPEPYTTNFSEDEIRIYFDEYVKLKNSQQQIIISPPIEPKPSITPLGGPSKTVKIEFGEDALRDNTTYTINFGRSIEDNNEGNPLEFYKYVFSTGAYIDSLKLSGTVKDAFNKEADDFITVALYEVDSTYSDSSVYKEIPRYITNTLDSSKTFQLENLKAGTYKLIALKDNNNNYKFEPKSDKIGFVEKNITLPTDESFEITLFEEVLTTQFDKPKQLGKQHILFGYEGRVDSTSISLLKDNLPSDFEYRITKDKDADSLHYWFKPFLEETDSLVFQVQTGDYNDTIYTRFKDQLGDSLVINRDKALKLLLEKLVRLELNTPIESIDSTKFTVVDMDTLDVPFEVVKNKDLNAVDIKFDAQPKQRYSITAMPNAITDFFEQSNDTLIYTVPTKELSDYGDLIVTVENVQEYPIIIQLFDTNGNILYEESQAEPGSTTFKSIDPKTYSVRVIMDANGNGIWDSGNFLEKRQAEKITIFSDIEIRANSEIYQSLRLN